MSRKVYTIFTSDPTSTDFAMMDENGKKVDNITSYTIRGGFNELTTIDVEMVGVAANVQAGLAEVTFTCPGCEMITTHECKGPHS